MTIAGVLASRKGVSWQARMLRRAIRRRLQKWRYRSIDWGSIPVFFANSFPKSGTHLLVQILKGFTRIGPAVDSGLPAIVTFDSLTGLPRSSTEITKDLDSLLPGEVAFGHLHAAPEVIARLCRGGIIPYFILRDPRDVVISHVYYLTDMAPNHVHHQYYASLPSFEARLQVSILGRQERDENFPNIRRRFEPYLCWLKQLQVLTLRFEDFVLDREKAVQKVLDHAVQNGFPLAVTYQQGVSFLINSINPQRSPTFRSGKIGTWKEKFTPELKELFKDVVGDLLVQLGYEEDNNW